MVIHGYLLGVEIILLNNPSLCEKLLYVDDYCISDGIEVDIEVDNE